MRRLVLFGLLPLALHARGQVAPITDTTTQQQDTLQLGEHRVRGVLFRHDRGLAAAGTTLDSALLNTYERASLQGALAWVPGVQMDTRGLGGSARLSMRGSMLRAPFGVRGVKVYWGPFPITLADGTTPLELLDPLVIGELEAVRSIGSPVYGSAPAGSLLAGLPEHLRDGPSASVAYTHGTNGFDRAEGTFGARRNGQHISAGAVWQENKGYRTQESSNKQQAFVVGGLSNQRNSITCALTYQHAYWQLPGSLDSSAAINAPTAANAWSQRINAHVDKSQVFGGLHAEQRVGKRWLLRATLSGQHIDKKNPYGTSSAFSGVKDETYRAFGARISAGGKARTGAWHFGWELGAEALYEVDDLLDSAYNANAELTTARTDARFTATNATPYLVVQAQLRNFLWLFAGLGSELNLYTADDRLAQRADDGLGRESIWPHAGVRWRLVRALSIHTRYAEGVSRPTITEVWTGTELNPALRPERVKEVELGFHANSADTLFRASLTGFWRTVHDLIQTFDHPSYGPITSNGHGVAIRGLEAEGVLHHAIRDRVLLDVRGYAAWQVINHYHPGGGIGMSPITLGTPPLSGGLLLRLQNRGGWRAMVSARYMGETVVSDQLDISVPAVLLCSARLAYEFRIARRGAVEVFVLGENLLDQWYSGWLQVNDQAGRYYNPAPGLSFFGGLRVRLR